MANSLGERRARGPDDFYHRKSEITDFKFAQDPDSPTVYLCAASLWRFIMLSKRIFLVLWMTLSLASAVWAAIDRIDLRVEGMT